MKRSIDAARVPELLHLQIPLSREERISIVFVQPPESPLDSCLSRTPVLLSRNKSQISRDSSAWLTWPHLYMATGQKLQQHSTIVLASGLLWFSPPK